jgi:hypothetical protein
MIGDVVIPKLKVLRRNLGHHVRCSHMIATRSALGIVVVKMRLTTHTLLLNLCLSSQSLTHFVGNRGMLTCIMSTIPHEHVHRVFRSMCIMQTFKDHCTIM